MNFFLIKKVKMNKQLTSIYKILLFKYFCFTSVSSLSLFSSSLIFFIFVKCRKILNLSENLSRKVVISLMKSAYIIAAEACFVFSPEFAFFNKWSPGRGYCKTSFIVLIIFIGWNTDIQEAENRISCAGSGFYNKLSK